MWLWILGLKCVYIGKKYWWECMMNSVIVVLGIRREYSSGSLFITVN